MYISKSRIPFISSRNSSSSLCLPLLLLLHLLLQLLLLLNLGQLLIALLLLGLFEFCIVLRAVLALFAQPLVLGLDPGFAGR